MTHPFDHWRSLLRRSVAVGTAAGIALCAGAATAGDLPGEGVKVRPIINHTTEELFQTYIVGRGLEALGYELEELQFAQVQLAQVAVAQNDADYYPSHWYPLHKAFHEESGGDARMQKVGVLIEGALQGYLIDKKTADEHGIALLDELKDPAVAQIFDADGDGMADLYGCEPGWGCERVIEHQLTAYGLRDTVAHRQGGYFAIIPDAIERIQAGEPTLYYTWTPMWLSGILRPGRDVSWLNVPYTDHPAGVGEDQTTVEGLGNLGFAVNTIHVIANTEFLEANPAAKKWFELVKVSNADISAQNLKVYEGENSEEDIQRHVDEWIAANQADWDAWIEEAKQAGSM